ncbi:MAG: hypothetical protein ABIX12_06480, partial [Rubrivivax sp.]
MTPLTAALPEVDRPVKLISVVWPTLIEALMVLAAVVALQPMFARVAAMGDGRDGRFAEVEERIDGLPAPVLPGLCARYAALAAPGLAERLCGTVGMADPSNGEGSVPALAFAVEQALRAFKAPVDAAQARLDDLRRRQRDADGDVLAASDAMNALDSRVQAFVERYVSAAQPLSCTLAWLQALSEEPAPSAAVALRHGSAGDSAGGNAGASAGGSRGASAALLVAAAIDGRAVTAEQVDVALGPAAAHALPSCPLDAGQALSRSATLMRDAHRSASNARKNEAMRALLLGAGWQWAGATGIGFVLLLWSRSARAPALGVATALAAWAGAAWLARVGWPLAPHPGFEPARPAAALDQAFDAPPAGFVLWLLGGAAVLLLTALVAAPRPAARPRAAAPSSRIGYAGLALATGLGWLLLLDLS